MPTKKQRILVWLSWWVDSAVAAHLLLEQWYEVIAGFMKNYAEPTNPHCHTRQDRDMALKVASHLGIKTFIIFDFRQEYDERIIQYIINWYKQGLTPNPDVFCNNLVKFDLFAEKARELGCDGVATGHYAQRLSDENTQIATLNRGRDPKKDQSYFLSRLSTKQLSFAHFPLWKLTKESVRETARDIGLPNADRKDSQWLCFIGKIGMKEFLSKHIPEKKWDIVLADGSVVWTHMWTHLWTAGQSRGLDLNRKAYVIATDIEKNLVVVSREREDENLLSDSIDVFDWQWIAEEYKWVCWEKNDMSVQIRYRQEAVSACLIQQNNSMKIMFDIPQWWVVSWQIAVAYVWNRVVWSGIIKTDFQPIFSSIL